MVTSSLVHRFPLLRGRHERPADGRCTLEAVAWLAGEEHSDRPRACCPVIASYVRALNDLLPDITTRERHLRPLVARLVGTTADSRAVERQRAFVAADAAVRTFAPRALVARDRVDDADVLRALGPIVDAPSAFAAAAALRRHGSAETRAAAWTCRRAAQGVLPPEQWVTGAAHAAREAEAWREARLTALRMVDGVARAAPS